MPDASDAPDHARFMAQAVTQAELALAAGDGPIGAVIVVDGDVVAHGRNHARSRGSRIEHAEIDALRNAAAVLEQRAADCTLYTTLEPCVMCLGAIAMAGVRRVVFGAPDAERGGAQTRRHVPYVRDGIDQYLGGVLEAQCAELVRGRL